MLLHVLGHVEADHLLGIAEQEGRQGLGQLRLAHARGAQEEERAHGPVGVLEARPGPAHGAGHGAHRLGLADDALVELGLHVHQVGLLVALEGLHGNARPAGHHVLDVLLSHLGEAGVVLLRQLAAVLLELLAELQLPLAQEDGLFEIATQDRLVHLVDDPVQLLFVGLALGILAAGPHAQLHPGAGLVQQVDGLVGQEAVGDVAVGQVDRGLHGLLGVAHPVEQLVAAADALDDAQALGLVRGVHRHRLEAPHQAAVLVDVLGVFLVRGGADALDLAPAEGRLQDVGRVQAALGRARADEAVDLVDEEHHAGVLAGLGDDGLQALLELAAVLGARHHEAEVQGVDALVHQAGRHQALVDLLGQALHDGRLAHARLAQQDGVVLPATAEDLDDALDLRLPADEVVEDAALGHLREVARELGEERVLLLLLRDLLLLGALQQDLLGGDEVRAGLDQEPARQAALLLEHAQQQVLGPHVLVVELGALGRGVLEDALDLLLHGDVDAGAAGGDLLVPGGQGRHQALPQGAHLHAHAFEELGAGLLRLPEEPQQEVAALDALRTELTRLVAGEEHHASGFFGEFFEHGTPFRVSCGSPLRMIG